jgi:hypothetical protein
VFVVGGVRREGAAQHPQPLERELDLGGVHRLGGADIGHGRRRQEQNQTQDRNRARRVHCDAPFETMT